MRYIMKIIPIDVAVVSIAAVLTLALFIFVSTAEI